MVDAIVQSVIEKAANAIVDEGVSLFNIQKNIDSVQETMKSLLLYLKEVESKKTGDLAANNLIVSIRDLAQDAEDMLDTYFAKIDRPDSTKGVLRFLKRNSRILIHCLTVYQMNRKSEVIKASADRLEKIKEQLQPELADVEVWSERRNFLLAGRETHKIPAREKALDKLEKELQQENTKSKIITIVGPGGIGKTTVAKKIYQNLTKNQLPFQRCRKAMVYVSPEAEVEKVLRDIAKQVGLSDHQMDEHLVKNLYLHLQSSRYVIFLDDVWNKRTWDQLKDALMTKSENGSRVIVTTRDTHVGRYINDTAAYIGVQCKTVPLVPLSQQSAEELFQTMITAEYDKEIREPLKKIGKKIVEKCGGLPLAIEVVVGMLRGKQRTVSVWNDVLVKMSQIPENDCLKLLALSYNDLTPRLKPLFLYLGIFPENHEINVAQLIPLWIAEKFIPDDGKQEDYVDQQIKELSDRNLVQVTRKKSDGRARTCRLHSVVYDLCRQLAEDNNYFCTRNNLKSSDVDSKIRRRVTTNTMELNKNAFQGVQTPKLRALFCFYRDEELYLFLKDNASDFQFLRLLIIEFGDGKAVKVPEEIANLSGIIYLKMIGNLSEIPAGIRKLKMLHTLEIRSKDIPEAILKMKHVKHLFLSSSMVVKQAHYFPCSKPRDLNKEVKLDLPSIESLDIDFGPNFSVASSSIKRLTNLKRLAIYVTKRGMLDGIFPVEPVLPKLEALKLKIYLSFIYEYEFGYNDQAPLAPKLDLSHHVSIKKLILYFDNPCIITGKVVFPPNVVKISLTRVINMDDHMDSLRKLSDLERLKLKRCKAEKLDFSTREGNFPHLNLLFLKETQLKELIIDKNGIAKLVWFGYEPSPLSENAKIPEALSKRNERTNSYEERV